MKTDLSWRFALAAVLLAAGLAPHASAQSTETADPVFVEPIDPLLAESGDPLLAESFDPILANDSDPLLPFAEKEVEQVSLSKVANSISPERRSLCVDCQNLGFCDWWKVAPVTRQVAFGLTGAAGDSETLDLATSFDSKRVWGRHSMFTDLDYFYSRANVATTKNRLYSLSRYERAIVGTPWSWFVDGWFEYDQFKPYDVRVATHAGLIRTCIKTERQLFRVLAGVGAAKTYGGVAEGDWKAEPEFGMLYECTLNTRQKLYASALYYPEIDDPRYFRINIKAGYEVKLSDVRNVALRLWAYNRYDNTDLTIVAPNVNPNALDYAASLVFGF